ncbi:hypothetical protein G6F65_019346 [Rhizopus arrhizus]|nr:hypothetical protein G6F65_019346 [Rhizopus arrhizus]
MCGTNTTGRVEARALLQGAADLVQRAADGGHQRHSVVGGLHAVGGAHEKLGIEDPAQAVERAADRRLGAVDALPGQGHVTLRITIIDFNNCTARFYHGRHGYRKGTCHAHRAHHRNRTLRWRIAEPVLGGGAPPGWPGGGRRPPGGAPTALRDRQGGGRAAAGDRRRAAGPGDLPGPGGRA